LESAKEYISAEIEKVKDREGEIQKQLEVINELKQDLNVMAEERDVWKGQHASAVQELERQSLARNDVEHLCIRIRKDAEAFDHLKENLENQVEQGKVENRRLLALLNKPMAHAEIQVSVQNQTVMLQTDLSYQYLESSERLQTEKWRRERLDALKKASNFVVDEDESRDFNLKFRTAANPVLYKGGPDLALIAEETGSGKATVVQPPSSAAKGGRTIASLVSGGRSKNDQNSFAGGDVPPVVPEPWPTAQRPMGQPPPSARSAQSIRGGQVSAPPRLEGSLGVSRVVTGDAPSVSSGASGASRNC